VEVCWFRGDEGSVRSRTVSLTRSCDYLAAEHIDHACQANIWFILSQRHVERALHLDHPAAGKSGPDVIRDADGSTIEGQ
jgi:hypothetical protein